MMVNKVQMLHDDCMHDDKLSMYQYYDYDFIKEHAENNRNMNF